MGTWLEAGFQVAAWRAERCPQDVRTMKVEGGEGVPDELEVYDAGDLVRHAGHE